MTIAAFFVVGGSQPAQAAGPFTVNTTSDTHCTGFGSQGNPGCTAVTDTSGHISLRSAMDEANTAGGSTQINLPSGTYDLSLGDLVAGTQADTTITIHGTGTAANTTINQTVAGRMVIVQNYNVNSNVVLQMDNVTVSGGSENENDPDGFGGNGGAILAGGSASAAGVAVTLTNTAFSGNFCSPVANAGCTGGAITMTGGGNLTVSNSTFSGNTASKNRGFGGGGAIYFDNGGNGGNVSITNSTFTNNTAQGNATTGGVGGGIFLAGGTGTTYAINSDVFTGNATVGTGGPHGGALYVPSGSLSASFNRIVGNTSADGSGLYVGNNAGTVGTATNNWWGCNTGPSAAPCDTAVLGTPNQGGSMTVSPWIVLTNTASPNPIQVNQNTTFTADFLHNSTGGTLTASQVTRLLGLPVTWSNAVRGSVSSPQTSIQANGTATATFTASAAGAGSADATVDSGVATGSVTIDKAPTSTSIGSDTPDPTVTGQSYIVTYSVTSSTGSTPTAPTGNVTVSDGTSSCTGTSVAGQCTLTSTSAGAKTLSATYAGDANFLTSTSAGVAHTVNKADTTTTITSDLPDPSVTGQSAVAMYSVAVTAPGSGAPTGNVTVSDGTVSCTGSVSAGQCTLTFTSAGAKTLTATYSGDSNYNASASSSEAHTVNKADTTTAITSDSPDPSDVGAGVTVEYSVTPNSPGAGTPTGNVTVSDGVASCTGAVAAGQCVITLNTPGTRTLTATYAGDSDFNGSTSAGEPHSVNQFGTTTSITSDTPDPSVVGQSVPVQYSVTPSGGSGAPTGNVTVSDGTVSCTGTVAAGQCLITFTSAGAKSLTASYAGDSSFIGSTSAAEPHTVNQAGSTTTITSDNPDPSVVGQSVTVQYSVAPVAPGAGAPTGNVTVSDGTVSCTGSVAAGQCDITFTSAGAKSLTAIYAGDSNFTGSTSAAEPHTVNQAGSTTTITSDNPDPSVVGQSVTVQYSVAPVAPGAGAPTGNVTVSDGTVSCTGSVAAGQCDITFTSAGAKSLTAIYAGDSNFTGSTSAGEPHTVNGEVTTTSITSDNPDPSVVGQSVTVQYSVTPSGGSGAPTGNVTVSDGVVSCTGTVAAGQCDLTFTSSGAKTLTASYAGDSSFNASTSVAEPHTVNQAGTTTTITSDNPDPSVAGQSVTVQYAVAVTSPGAGTPSGNVTVSDGVDTCTGTVAAGQCDITLTTVGSRSLTASYTGDSNFNGSTSAGETHTVNPPNTPPTATVTNGQCSSTNLASGAIDLTLADADNDPMTLTLASNSNAILVPNANIVLSGTGANRRLTVTTAAKKSGSATLTLNLSDGKATVPVVVTVIVGTATSDTLNGTTGIDMIFGLAGRNTINGNGGNDLLCGGNASDTLKGGAGNDILDGGNGDDVLNGGTGDDILRGNLGNDTLTGGTGADFFSGGPGTDIAIDFNAGQGDTQDGTVP